MDRRTFLHRSAWSLPALLSISPLLEACRKDDLPENIKFKGKVAVIGAGAAGLYAAYLLKKYGVNVTIYEASESHGGRIKALNGFADFPIEIGAELIKGNKSVLYDLIRSTSAELSTELGTDYFKSGDALVSRDTAANSPDFAQMFQKIEDIAVYTGGELNAEAYRNTNGIASSVQFAFDSIVSNRRGTSSDHIGIQGIAEELSEQASGNQEYVIKNRSLISVFEEKFADILPLIQYNTPIVHINYADTKVLLTDAQGNIFETQRVIVTSPINVLFDGDLDFTPNLPSLHLQAISKIGMDRGISISLKFTDRFWPADARRIVIPGIVPEFRPAGFGGRSSAAVLNAFVCGAAAETLLDSATFLNDILAQLDSAFGGTTASSRFVIESVTDWGDVPYIKGCMSYPKPYCGNSRALLSEPVANKIFFAGEATHTAGHHGTVHGAMETGMRAALEVLQS